MVGKNMGTNLYLNVFQPKSDFSIEKYIINKYNYNYCDYEKILSDYPEIYTHDDFLRVGEFETDENGYTTYEDMLELMFDFPLITWKWINEVDMFTDEETISWLEKHIGWRVFPYIT